MTSSAARGDVERAFELVFDLEHATRDRHRLDVVIGLPDHELSRSAEQGASR